MKPDAFRPHEAITRRYTRVEEKSSYLRGLFDRSARHYDRMAAIAFFRSGHLYRKRAVTLAGLRPGMSVLDVACGTGAVTRAILDVLQGQGRVVGVDPSEGMLAEARKGIGAEFRTGTAEQLPVSDAEFDFLTMGFALRHVEDLVSAFIEYRRVLKPGGRLLLLEVARPRNRAAFVVARFYFRDVLPRLARWVTRSEDARELYAYYWETIEACVPREMILAALREAGFQNVNLRTELGLCIAYSAERGA